LEIKEGIYRDNLLFYTVLKNLLQCKFNERQLIQLQEVLLTNKETLNSDKMKKFLLSSIVKEGTTKYEDFCILVNMCKRNNYAQWVELLDLSIDLLLIKDLIREEAKAYARSKYKEKIEKIKDKLSLEYDMASLELPYGQRVISSLLVYALTSLDRDTDFLMENSKKMVKDIKIKLQQVTEKYKININNIFMIIVDESVNQSIKSDAGQSYEKRLHSLLMNIGENVKEHVHDEMIPSVEYDFTFEIGSELVGISAKRTLRERYKQNFEDVDFLSVDHMLLITLGTDLNSDKLNNILQKNGLFVVVSREVYDTKEYLVNNPRVIPSDEFTTKKLNEMFK